MSNVNQNLEKIISMLSDEELPIIIDIIKEGMLKKELYDFTLLRMRPINYKFADAFYEYLTEKIEGKNHEQV